MQVKKLSHDLTEYIALKDKFLEGFELWLKDLMVIFILVD